MKLKNKNLLADSVFLLNSALFSLFTFAILRMMLIIRNNELLDGIPIIDVLNSFLIGMRFDLIVVSYAMLPLVFALLLPHGLGKRKIAFFWLIALFGLFQFLAVVELDFYHEFHNRLNSIAFQYLKEDPTTVSSMIWNGFPVIRYLLLWFFLVFSYAYILKIIASYRLPEQSTPNHEDSSNVIVRVITVILLLIFLIIGARGGTIRSGPPLRWGDAFHSTHLFTNHMALNGTFTILKALRNESHEVKGKKWLKSLPKQEALNTT
ncbi:MAG: LTA synthase family protein, partial [gamma proteobacterium symbiont of Bathyaustriella thionipta]|nr:LTA synthase family protein [gamma proteobacterium symbiont of Bathyaustriella thionipta]